MREVRESVAEEKLPAFSSLTLTSLVSEKQESFGELGVDSDDFQRIGVTGSQEIIECRIEVTDSIVKNLQWSFCPYSLFLWGPERFCAGCSAFAGT